VSHCVCAQSKAKLPKYENSGSSAPKRVIMAYKGLGSKVPCALTKVRGGGGCFEDNTFHAKITLHALLLHIREVPSSNLVPEACYPHWGLSSGRTVPKTRSSSSEFDVSCPFYNSKRPYINRKSM
jgi:hypothetical protein